MSTDYVKRIGQRSSKGDAMRAECYILAGILSVGGAGGLTVGKSILTRYEIISLQEEVKIADQTIAEMERQVTALRAELERK